MEPVSPKQAAAVAEISQPMSPQAKLHSQDFKVVKEEIETRMDELNEDLKRIEEAHTQPKQKVLRRSQPIVEKLSANCDLARSTQRFSDHQDERPKQHKVKASQEAIRDLAVIVDRKRSSQLALPTKKKSTPSSTYPFLPRSQSTK